jgi:hypothetical protein
MRCLATAAFGLVRRRHPCRAMYSASVNGGSPRLRRSLLSAASAALVSSIARISSSRSIARAFSAIRLRAPTRYAPLRCPRSSVRQCRVAARGQANARQQLRHARLGAWRVSASLRRRSAVTGFGVARPSSRFGRIAGVDSGRTAVRAKAVIPLRARNRLHRPERKLPRIEAALAQIATAHSSGIPALRRPSYDRSLISTKRGSPPCLGTRVIKCAFHAAIVLNGAVEGAR